MRKTAFSMRRNLQERSLRLETMRKQVKRLRRPPIQKKKK